ncbi:glycosyl hydrolase family 79 C-terminal domain-containing protein [Paraburkholderia sp. HP33-1]|uniref:glycosyl hydrolase family 79 C-terminal domain-containing protein n=1 Tax=Paraburkholderia sp. HP33-1 TaxID=2883243 RepID=UPI001F3887B7|nr:glycosyl hydrolase family 79 C-terminal domain-containing protein [Paraburkholderia sp. HP33-1]
MRNAKTSVSNCQLASCEAKLTAASMRAGLSLERWGPYPWFFAISVASTLLTACGGSDIETDPIAQFSADKTTVSQGQAVTLSWSAPNAQSVTLSGVSATPASSAVVVPAQSTTYTLTATNSSGGVFTKTITVSVASSTPMATVTVDPTNPGTQIPSGYIGFSHPWGQAQLLMGDPAIGVNPIYRQLLKNITKFGGGPVSIRIGGTVSDSTTEPNSGTVRPFAQLANDLSAAGYGATFILGINFAAKNATLASDQVSEYASDMPAGALQSIELGNEPDLYVLQKVRPSPYSFDQYTTEVQTITQAILSKVPNSPLFTGPSAAFYPQDPATGALLPPFLSVGGLTNLLSQSGSVIANVSQHSYITTGTACGGSAASGLLLKPSSSTSDPSYAVPFAAVAKAANKPYRIDEMNSISCEGQDGVSNAFEEALWAPDVMFEYAKAGATGVNMISKNWNKFSAWDVYGAFNFNLPQSQYDNLANIAVKTWTPPAGIQWSNGYSIRTIQALYYGMLLFAEAAENGSSLLPVTLNTSANLKAWSTLDPTTGKVNVLVINKDQQDYGNISVTVPGFKSAAIERMRAPAFTSKSGITLGGQTFDGSVDGTPVGTKYAEVLTEQSSTFNVAIEPTSAVLVTLSK